MIKLGQHFLINKSALEKIAELVELRKGDIVLEVGPGHGELTSEVIKQLGNLAIDNFKIIAMEKDERLAEELRKKFAEEKKIEVVTGDVLKILPSIIAQLPNSLIAEYKLIGNIPYYITGKLLRTISELAQKPKICVFTIQKEVAERLTAKPPKMNRLAASVQFWSEPEIVLALPRNYFNPAPEVDSATIVLKTSPTRNISSDAYYKIVRAVFGQPRKTILNNIADGLEIPKREAIEKLKSAGIEPNSRPQNLSVEYILKLASIF